MSCLPAVSVCLSFDVERGGNGWSIRGRAELGQGTRLCRRLLILQFVGESQEDEEETSVENLKSRSVGRRQLTAPVLGLARVLQETSERLLGRRRSGGRTWEGCQTAGARED